MNKEPSHRREAEWLLLFLFLLAGVGRSCSAPQLETEAKVLTLNEATETELTALPGIGSRLAGRIVSFRESGRLKVKRDLLRIPGVGQSLFEKIENSITVENR